MFVGGYLRKDAWPEPQIKWPNIKGTYPWPGRVTHTFKIFLKNLCTLLLVTDGSGDQNIIKEAVPRMLKN